MGTPFINPGLGATAAQVAARGTAANGKFIVINLCGDGMFVFDFFPTEPISLSRRANWPEQDTTIGTKPLFYANRDPRKLDVQQVWLDRTFTDESITPQIEALMALQDEICEGTPPPVLVLWGDRQERAVLEDIRIEETFHHQSGYPMRARVTLSFKQVQRGDR
jgi:contractile injection system tube protein